jgi:hypothetical protein
MRIPAFPHPILSNRALMTFFRHLRFEGTVKGSKGSAEMPVASGLVTARRKGGRMIKRMLLLGVSGALVLGFAAPTTVQALPHGALCKIHGQVPASGGTGGFSPALTVKPRATSYTFSGSLSSCQKGTVSTKATAPNPSGITGSVTASGSGTLSCEAGYSKGTATVTWNNPAPVGTTTSKLTYTAVGAGAVTLVEGKVISSTDPDVKANDLVGGALAFQTSTPQNCATTGLTSATFDGVTGSGMLK